MKRELFTKKEESVPGLKVLENEDLKSVSGGVTLDMHNIMTGDHPHPNTYTVDDVIGGISNRDDIEQASDPIGLSNITKMEMQEELDRLKHEASEQWKSNGNGSDGSEYPGNRLNIEDLLEPESNPIDTEMEKEMESFREEMQRQISGNQTVLANQDPFDNLQFLR